jgi:hypothetical protein
MKGVVYNVLIKKHKHILASEWHAERYLGDQGSDPLLLPPVETERMTRATRSTRRP